MVTPAPAGDGSVPNGYHKGLTDGHIEELYRLVGTITDTVERIEGKMDSRLIYIERRVDSLVRFRYWVMGAVGMIGLVMPYLAARLGLTPKGP